LASKDSDAGDETIFIQRHDRGRRHPVFHKNEMPTEDLLNEASPKPEFQKVGRVIFPMQLTVEAVTGFGRGALLWSIGIPLPIILLLALFMHH
jgi:hypothetical protein